VCAWVDKPVQIVSLEPNSLADVWSDIERVAEALGTPERGRELVGQLRTRMRRIEQRAATASERPRLALIEWIEPLMTAGHWMPELVDLAAGVNLFGEAGKHAPRITWRDLVAADPDLIIAQPCGFDLPRTRQEMASLASTPEWPTLRAVRNGKVFVTDGNQFFNRPGPRLVESLEILAEIVHPELFAFGHHGAGWDSMKSSDRQSKETEIRAGP
jgi:iron complex transport system substrate-binding protein